jgi:hypothetical protein
MESDKQSVRRKEKSPVKKRASSLSLRRTELTAHQDLLLAAGDHPSI